MAYFSKLKLSLLPSAHGKTKLWKRVETGKNITENFDLATQKWNHNFLWLYNLFKQTGKAAAQKMKLSRRKLEILNCYQLFLKLLLRWCHSFSHWKSVNLLPHYRFNKNLTRDNLISASSSDFVGLFWLTRGSPRAVNARRKSAHANQVPGTKSGPKCGPQKK